MNFLSLKSQIQRWFIYIPCHSKQYPLCSQTPDNVVCHKRPPLFQIELVTALMGASPETNRFCERLFPDIDFEMARKNIGSRLMFSRYRHAFYVNTHQWARQTSPVFPLIFRK